MCELLNLFNLLINITERAAFLQLKSKGKCYLQKVRNYFLEIMHQRLSACFLVKHP